MHERVEHWLHELVVQCPQVVVGQLDVLKAVEVLERGGGNFFNPVRNGERYKL